MPSQTDDTNQNCPTCGEVSCAVVETVSLKSVDWAELPSGSEEFTFIRDHFETIEPGRIEKVVAANTTGPAAGVSDIWHGTAENPNVAFVVTRSGEVKLFAKVPVVEDVTIFSCQRTT